MAEYLPMLQTFSNFHLHWQLASSLKISLSPPKLKWALTFLETLSPFTLLYVLLFTFCAQVKQQATQSRKQVKLLTELWKDHLQGMAFRVFVCVWLVFTAPNI